MFMMKYIFILFVFLGTASATHACSYEFPEDYEQRYDYIFIGKLNDYSFEKEAYEVGGLGKKQVTEHFTFSVIKSYSGSLETGAVKQVSKLSRGSGSSCDVYPVFGTNEEYSEAGEYYFLAHVFEGQDTMSGDGPNDTQFYIIAKSQEELESYVMTNDAYFSEHFVFEPGLPELTEEVSEGGEVIETSEQEEITSLYQQILHIVKLVAALKSRILGF